jgi:hypothetical protein
MSGGAIRRAIASRRDKNDSRDREFNIPGSRPRPRPRRLARFAAEKSHDSPLLGNSWILDEPTVCR